MKLDPTEAPQEPIHVEATAKPHQNVTHHYPPWQALSITLY